jgi:D-xylose transport system permease protein
MSGISLTPTQKVPSATEAGQAREAALPLRDFSMVIALLLIWGFFWLTTPIFVSSRNLSNLAVEMSITAVLALGMLLIIITGNIDLSIGSGVGLLGGLASILIIEHNWGAPAAMGLAFVVAVLIWLAMGALIVTQRIPAFIVTLAGLMIFRGLHWKVIHNATIPVAPGGTENLYSFLTTWYLPPFWSWVLAAVGFGAMVVAHLRERQKRLALGFPVPPGDLSVARLLVTGQIILLFVLICNQFRGIPLPVIILAATALVIWTITQHTRLGRYLYAIGGNEEAARISGVPVRRIVISAFGIMGALVALGGFLQTAYAGASTTTTGNLLELDAIAACVIGGAALKGGRGTVAGVLFGSLIMASLMNGMTLMAVSPETKYVARGLVLALAVWLDTRLADASGQAH